MKNFLLLSLLCVAAFAVSHHRNEVIKTRTFVPHVKSPEPWEYMDMDALPTSYDIRNISEMNCATIDRNQHLPQYCGSCWAHSTTSALADRFKLMYGCQMFPEPEFSIQSIIECGNAGTCDGGDAGGVYDYIHDKGVGHETCNLYQAKNLACNAQSLCYTCDTKCAPVTNYTHYYAAETGTVAGVPKMMAEITARGPIACTMTVTNNFVKYNGGIITNDKGTDEGGHVISIAGFGTENGVDYWIGRNSWGTAWGENGWFRVKRGADLFGLEEDCYWATPKPL